MYIHIYVLYICMCINIYIYIYIYTHVCVYRGVRGSERLWACHATVPVSLVQQTLVFLYLYVSLSGLKLGDIKVYESQIRAHLGTARLGRH